MKHYLMATGRLFEVEADTETQAKEKLRKRLGMGRCPNNTRVIIPIKL
jgi:hypothetical protein